MRCCAQERYHEQTHLVFLFVLRRPSRQLSNLSEGLDHPTGREWLWLAESHLHPEAVTRSNTLSSYRQRLVGEHTCRAREALQTVPRSPSSSTDALIASTDRPQVSATACSQTNSTLSLDSETRMTAAHDASQRECFEKRGHAWTHLYHDGISNAKLNTHVIGSKLVRSKAHRWEQVVWAAEQTDI